MSGSGLSSVGGRRGGTVVAVLVGLLVAAGSASAKTVFVCPSGCAFRQVAPAIPAAAPGDTIRIAAGEYRGGFTIDKSLNLRGAGAPATVIGGGGPVVTIGAFLAHREPKVGIEGVTITGGSVASGPFGSEIAAGGGILIPPRADFRSGATVTISDSVIAHNRATPAASEPFGPPCPGGKSCPFAGAFGGGIDNEGNLTLVGTTISDNRATGPIASDSDGGGIYSGSRGSLTIRDSVIERNLASVSAPNGRFAEGGGIFASDGETVLITRSQVNGNRAELSSSFPYHLGGDQTLQIGANSGGVHIGNDGSLDVENSRLAGNTVSIADLSGQPEGFDSALCDCGSSSLMLRNTTITDNHLIAHVGSTADVFACCGLSVGGTLEADGRATIRDTRIVGNRTTVNSPSGAAIASAAVFSTFYSESTASLIEGSTIRGNQAVATSISGSARVIGAGLINAGALRLSGDQIVGNTAVAQGPTALAQGAGIWNGRFPGGPPVRLTIEHSRVTGNTPDDCFGVSC
ncbi:MAG: right-handed parallel beta-helix repeat-containing protein [Actinomycetota bacterium]|nr:right-handed parallel beta-helix repeat-containing protein [Actinomycetota bacterium]